MSPPRCTPEFKDEAVRQITERGYSVAEVSARLVGSRSKRTSQSHTTVDFLRDEPIQPSNYFH
jgi:transposase-like protein